tara:strand:+ start:365 stop:2404 length:2040 start_codon:yes stop_codon:yes gene_type:complete
MRINKISNKLYSDEDALPDIVENETEIKFDYGETGSDTPELNAFQSANDQVAIEEAIPSQDNIQNTIKKTEIEQVMSSNNPDVIKKYLWESRRMNVSKSTALDIIKRFNASKITEGSGRVRSESTQIKSTFAMEQELDVLKKQLASYGEVSPSTYSAGRAKKKAKQMYGKSMLQGPSKAGTGGVPLAKLNPTYSASKAYLEGEIFIREEELKKFKQIMGKSDDVVDIETRLKTAGVLAEDLPLATENVSKVKNPEAKGITGLTDKNNPFFIDDKIELYDAKRETKGPVTQTTKINNYLEGPGKFGNTLNVEKAERTLNNIPNDLTPSMTQLDEASFVANKSGKKIYGTSSNMQYITDRAKKSTADLVAGLMKDEAEAIGRQAEEIINQERVIRDPEDGKLKKVSYTSLDAQPRDNSMVQSGPTTEEVKYAEYKGQIGSSPDRNPGSKDFDIGWLDRQDKKLLSDSRLKDAIRTEGGKFSTAKKLMSPEMQKLAKAANEAEFRQKFIAKVDRDLQSKVTKSPNIIDTPKGEVSRGPGDTRVDYKVEETRSSKYKTGEYDVKTDSVSGQGPRTPNARAKVQGPGLTGKTLYEEQIGRRFARPASGVGLGQSTNKGVGIRATDAKLKADASLAAKARKAVGLAYGAGKVAKAATKLNPALSMLSMLPKQTFDDILYNKKPQA